MNITAIFRDFLIRNHAKTKYERNMTFNGNASFPLDWSGNNLFYTIKKNIRKKYYIDYFSCDTRFANALVGASVPLATFSWARSPEGYLTVNTYSNKI